jgi:hypothetical protein
MVSRKRRYCHTTGHNRLIYQWNSNQQGGYFYEGRNIMECLGDELYCFIEERAQFGQVLSITAGCEQMAQHPMVNPRDQGRLISESYSQLSQVHAWNNQEPARGNAEGYNVRTFYGLGGCLSVAAQNGQKAFETDGDKLVGTDSVAFDQSKENNFFRFGNRWANGPTHPDHKNNFGLNQCLRFPTSRDPALAAPGNLLPFGVSVCRACCVAEFSDIDPAVAPDTFKDNICNYPPDFDTHIADQTDDPSGNHELIPRFDMAWAALNEYAHMDVARPNNLFIHGGYTDTCGPGKGRGCTANTCVQQILPNADCQSYPAHINGPYKAPGK